MRDVWAVVVARTGPTAKTRLGHALDPDSRIALAEAMLADVLRAARLAGLGGIVTVIGPATSSPEGVLAMSDPGTGHLGAIQAGIDAAGSAGAGCVVVLPGDLPLLRSDDVRDLAEAAAVSPSVVVAPDRGGTGTNALALRPPNVIAPAFGPHSLDRHLAAASAAGVTPRRLDLEGPALDIDTAADLAELVRRMPEGATRVALDRILRGAMPAAAAPTSGHRRG